MQAKKCTIVNFSGRFKSLCESSGKTQKKLAELLGTSESALVNYKKDRIPEADVLLRIAKHFNVSIEWLLTGNEPVGQAVPDQRALEWKIRAQEAEKKIDAMKAGLSAFIKKF